MSSEAQQSSAVTSPSLLDALNDRDDRAVWRRFVDRYEPMIQAFARKLGLSENDVWDVSQETLQSFVTAWRAGRYDRNKGRLRSWLFGIARNKAMDVIRHRRKAPLFTDRSDGSAFLAAIPAEEALTRSWDVAWETAKLHYCLEIAAKRVRPETIECFRLYVLDGQSADAVAQRLGMAKSTVFLTKHRMLRRIRECTEANEDRWQEARL